MQYELKEKLIAFLQQNFKEEQYSTNKEKLRLVSFDESSIQGKMPSILVFPRSTEEVKAIVEKAYELSFPITPRGAGTSLEGNSIPEEGGLVMDLSSLNAILDIREDDLQVELEPGVVYGALNKALSKYGLFFPPSPGGSSDTASIGGMIATNASGIYSVKYGATRDYVLKLTLVTGKAEIISIGSNCIKSSSGYNMVGLIAGSEGTLGVITKITLKLKGLKEYSKKFAVVFPKEENAISSISEMMRYGLDISALEYLDKECIISLNKLKGYGLEEKPSIFFEIQDSNQSSITDTYSYLKEICNDFSGQEITLQDGQNPWEIRHYVTKAIKLRQKNSSIIRNDIALPISKLPIVVNKCYSLASKESLLIHIFGHAGLGILHVLTLFDKNNEIEKDKAATLNKAIINFVLDIGGSTSGEHGIGEGLKTFMEKEHKLSLTYMKEIKKVFDPKNILNPSKIFP